MRSWADTTILRRMARWSAAGSGWTCLLLMLGCEAHPPTQSEDVVNYIRNAAVGADVKRLDPPAQEYVTGIWKAHTAWTAESGGFEAASCRNGLWAIDADEWRDAEKVAALAKVIGPWRGEAPPATEQAARSALIAAIAAAPSMPGEGGAALARSLAEALGADEASAGAANQRRAEIARSYGELLEFVSTHAGEFDSAGKGLAFKSPEASTKAADLWKPLDARFQSEHAARMAHVETVAKEGRARQQPLIDRKAELLKVRPRTPENEMAIRSLDFQIKRWDKQIADAERAYREHVREGTAKSGSSS